MPSKKPVNNKCKSNCKKKVNNKLSSQCDGGVCPIEKPKKKTNKFSNQSVNKAINSWQNVLDACDSIRAKKESKKQK